MTIPFVLLVAIIALIAWLILDGKAPRAHAVAWLVLQCFMLATAFHFVAKVVRF